MGTIVRAHCQYGVVNLNGVRHWCIPGFDILAGCTFWIVFVVTLQEGIFEIGNNQEKTESTYCLLNTIKAFRTGQMLFMWGKASTSDTSRAVCPSVQEILKRGFHETCACEGILEKKSGAVLAFWYRWNLISLLGGRYQLIWHHKSAAHELV